MKRIVAKTAVRVIVTTIVCLVLILIIYAETVFSLDFMRRGRCGDWHWFFLRLYGLANLAITGAYTMIPIVLLFPSTVKNGEKLDPVERKQILFTFAAFIFACGLGHLEGIISFQLPMYHFFALWHLFTAIVSWLAVYIIFTYRAKIITSGIF